MKTAVLLLTCPDQNGLVAKLANFVFELGGNIVELDEHVDADSELFHLRLAWNTADITLSNEALKQKFELFCAPLHARWSINFLPNKKRVALFVSQYDHCLLDILWRQQQQEYNFDIPLIVSNHQCLAPIAKQYNIPFHYFDINKENKLEQEQAQIALLKAHDIDTVVLARYMQILSSDFVRQYENNIINIHHSFLPAFIGANPYQQAFDRGVKIIGATSHFVTEDLDEGPIIEQDVVHISHKDSVEDLKRKGRDLERLVLARALHAFDQHKVLVSNAKTFIFN